MPTNPQTVLDLINQEIADNGAQLITAAVLRPVLIAMVEQINNLVGASDDLPGGSLTVVDALAKIAEEMPAGLTILSGSDDPNTNPPAIFSIGDFYQQTDGSNTLGFFQFNGNNWARIRTTKEEALRPINEISSSYVVADEDFTIIYSGSNPAHTIELPLASENPTRILKVVNVSNENINFTTVYTDKEENEITLIGMNSTVELQSTGSKWFKTN